MLADALAPRKSLEWAQCSVKVSVFKDKSLCDNWVCFAEKAVSWVCPERHTDVSLKLQQNKINK